MCPSANECLIVLCVFGEFVQIVMVIISVNVYIHFNNKIDRALVGFVCLFVC